MNIKSFKYFAAVGKLCWKTINALWLAAMDIAPSSSGSSSSLRCVFIAADAVAPRNTALGRHNVRCMYCAKRRLCPYAPVTAYPQCKQIQ